MRVEQETHVNERVQTRPAGPNSPANSAPHSVPKTSRWPLSALGAAGALISVPPLAERRSADPGNAVLSLDREPEGNEIR